MSTALYTNNFLNFLSNQNGIETKKIKHIFETPENVKDGHYLRILDDKGNASIIEFNEDIRDIKGKNGDDISHYIYKGNDFAKKYLVDKGFFVPDESLYKLLKQKYEFIAHLEYVYFEGEYANKEIIRSKLKDIKKYEYCTNDIKEKCDKDLDKLDHYPVNYSFPIKTYDSPIENYPDAIVIPQVIKSIIDVLCTIGMVVCFFLSLFRNYGGLATFLKSIFVWFVLCVLVPMMIEKINKNINNYRLKNNRKVVNNSNAAYKKLNEYISLKGDETLKESEEFIQNREKELLDNMNIMFKNNECDDNKYFVYSDHGYSATFRLNEINNLINLFMYCAYPFTFANGETFRAVSVNNRIDYIWAINAYFKMMDRYLEFLDEYVYPMIRKNGYRETYDLISLNKDIVEDIRVQMRIDQIRTSINILHEDLVTIHNDNLKIMAQLGMINCSIMDLQSSIEHMEANISSQISSLDGYYPYSIY